MSRQGHIFLVDDDEVVLRSLEDVLRHAGYEPHGFSSAEALLEGLVAQRPDCLIVDLRLQHQSGLDVLAELRRRGLQAPVLVISGHADVPLAVQSMKLGAYDFLEKPVMPDKLLNKLEEAMAASRTPGTAESLPSTEAERLTSLTPREIEILRHLVSGRSSKQIAYQMHLSEKTVSNHRAHLLAKTGAQNTAELVRIAVKNGIS